MPSTVKEQRLAETLLDPWKRTGYGSFLRALVRALELTDGPVLELGAGNWSTPFLHQYCQGYRDLVTVENHPDFRDRYSPLVSETHHIVAGFDPHEPWSVVLVDNDWEERATALDLDAEVFVVHDTDHLDQYPGLEAQIARFPRRRDYTRTQPWTTLLSWSVRV
jgi:hypothetical protein